MHVVRYLARQGLSLRGDRDKESDSNFIKLLKFMAHFDPVLEEWLKRKDNVYTSAIIQNEMIKESPQVSKSQRAACEQGGRRGSTGQDGGQRLCGIEWFI